VHTAPDLKLSEEAFPSGAAVEALDDAEVVEADVEEAEAETEVEEALEAEAEVDELPQAEADLVEDVEVEDADEPAEEADAGETDSD
jgi:hypothetical protein